MAKENSPRPRLFFTAESEWTALALTTFEKVARESNVDGTSDEGISYWSHGLSYPMQYLEGVQPVLGTRSLYDAPYFRRCIAARLHASTPDLSGTLPWGDARLRDFYGPHHMLYRLASEYRDGAGQFLAAHLPFGPVGGSDDDAWTALWYDPGVAEQTPLDLDHHSPVGGIVNTRSGWGPGDYLLSFKTGFTNVNHGHLDSGALAFCLGGDWLLKAPGYGAGKGEAAFWDRGGKRWEYLSNATESHSTLLVNGRNQRFTPEARSTVDSRVFGPGWMWTSADLTGAYEDVTQVRRSVLHRRGDYVLVFDEVATPARPRRNGSPRCRRRPPSPGVASPPRAGPVRWKFARCCPRSDPLCRALPPARKTTCPLNGSRPTPSRRRGRRSVSPRHSSRATAPAVPGSRRWLPTIGRAIKSLTPRAWVGRTPSPSIPHRTPRSASLPSDVVPAAAANGGERISVRPVVGQRRAARGVSRALENHAFRGKQIDDHPGNVLGVSVAVADEQNADLHRQRLICLHGAESRR